MVVGIAGFEQLEPAFHGNKNRIVPALYIIVPRPPTTGDLGQ